MAITNYIVKPVTTSDEMAACVAIRHQVFVVGQNISVTDEQDGLDPECQHYLACVDGKPVGTMRVRRLDADHVKFQRVAVLDTHRGLGLATAMLKTALEDLEDGPLITVVLEAQTDAKNLYQKLGFAEHGKEFEEVGRLHIKMQRTVGRRVERA